MFSIRIAEEKDLPALTRIYNHEVLHSDATFDITPKTEDERLQWLKKHNIQNHPLIVAEEQGEVIGYASLSCYRDMQAYRGTVELSVYVDSLSRGRGVGERLCRHIIDMARADSLTVTIVSVITSGNQSSIALHQKLGFEFCGEIKNVGVKNGRLLSIKNYQLMV